MINKIKEKIRYLINFFQSGTTLKAILAITTDHNNNYAYNRDKELHAIITNRQISHPNPFVRFGCKCFSQTDEDGLIIEILKRMKIEKGTFAEFGVGDGLENNTLILLSLGWKGFWVGGQDLIVNLTGQRRLKFEKIWVTKENINEIWSKNVEMIGSSQVDILSLDLDGNDFYLCEELLQNNVRPKIFIVEYNSKFPPPVEFTINYDPRHIWKGDDYFGASLQSFCNLFHKNGYSLICCNAASGANAFFIQNDFIHLFPEVPKEIEKIYSPPFYFVFRNYGHPSSVETVQRILSD